MKQKSMYDAGFEAGYRKSIVMILKVVMLSLYSHDWPADAMVEMKDDITDAVFFYAKNPEKLDEDIKTMEEAGVKIRFDGKEI